MSDPAMPDRITADDLAALRLFEGLDRIPLERLAVGAVRRRLPDGGTLFEQGRPADQLHLIVRGRLALRSSDGERSTVVQSVDAGDALGWSALREDPHWLTTARAIGAVEVISVPLAAVLDAFEAGGRNARILAQRLFAVGAAHLEDIRLQLQQPTSESIITGG